MYESDITKFLKELKEHKPDLEARQKQGRALLWDKPVDLESEADWRAARVPQRPYVYSSGDE